MLVVLAFMILVAVVVLALRFRPRAFLVSDRECLAVAGLVAVGLAQYFFRGAVRFDDLFFGPLYLAVPAWVGLRGGPAEGAFVAAVGGGPFMGLVAVLAPDAGDHAARAAAIGEYTLAALFLVGIGTLAGFLRRWPVAPAAAPVAWIPFVALVQPDLLRGAGPWIMIIAAGAWILAGRITFALLRKALNHTAAGDALVQPAKGE